MICTKSTTNYPIKTVTSIEKPTPTITAIDVQNDEEVVVMA